MGALTSNRKRGDEYLSLSHGFPSLNSPNSNLHSSKRPRLRSPPMNPSPVSSKSAISRVSRYPEASNPLPRLHAPTGNHKFRLNSGPNREGEPVSASKNSMGNILVSNYNMAKNLAFGAFRVFRKEKEVVELDRDVEDGVDLVGVSEDSCVEEIEVIEDDEEAGVVDLEQGNLRGLSDAEMASPSAVADAAMKVESLSLGADPSLEVFKRLIREADRRNVTLDRLKSDIELNEQRRNLFQSLRPTVKKPVEEKIPEEPFIALTKEEKTEVQRAFSVGNRKKVLVSHENSNIEITGQILQCLRPGAWLNDEVINVYLELLKEREKRDPKRYLKCHFFNTFFYKKLIGGGGYDFKSVRRWTTQRKLGYSLADCDKIFIPVHREVHWCLAVINKQDEKIQYLDSLKGKDYRVFQVLAKYYADEVKDKTGKEIDLTPWKQEFVEDLPQQLNGYDCGVFMIKYADFYSQGMRLCFSQEHMPYFRLRTAKEILKLRAE